MKNYSSNRAQKGKTAYRTPSRWKANQPEKFKRELGKINSIRSKFFQVGKVFLFAGALLFLGAGCKGVLSQGSAIIAAGVKPSQAISPPPAGKFYHGVFPGGQFSEEDMVTEVELDSYEKLVGKKAAWVYFTQNWFKGKEFPVKTAGWIRDRGSAPFLRLMLRSSEEQNVAEPVYKLDRIIKGDFDADLRAWARGAKNFGTPMLAEWGTEVNGEWFAWNGSWNGKESGPQKFRDAYKHIVKIAREEGANNISWVFHANSDDVPDELWNKIENYYPGDDWIDWIGVSIYGAGTPMAEPETFASMMDNIYPRLAGLSAKKPIAVLELGVSKNNPRVNQADWVKQALSGLTSGRWPRVIGFTWWNETWKNDNDAANNSVMRVQESSALAATMKKMVGEDDKFLGSLPATSAPKKVLPPSAPAAIWKPKPNFYLRWQWQLNESIDISVKADIFDIDLFDASKKTIAGLRKAGKKVICYFNAGAWEDWRSDKNDFPAEVIGNEYKGWSGEKWLDISNLEAISPIMKKRLDLAKEKGCHAVEPDNIDGYSNDTGFELTAADQLVYNKWLAKEAHSRGLSIGLKNDGDQAKDLVNYFDWALTEDCYTDKWCDDMKIFVAKGKAVFQIEYVEHKASLTKFCPSAKKNKFSPILKKLGLDAWRKVCPKN